MVYKEVYLIKFFKAGFQETILLGVIPSAPHGGGNDNNFAGGFPLSICRVGLLGLDCELHKLVGSALPHVHLDPGVTTVGVH